jgi:hypothetical protein
MVKGLRLANVEHSTREVEHGQVILCPLSNSYSTARVGSHELGHSDALPLMTPVGGG